jgi:hypothetical protein
LEPNLDSEGQLKGYCNNSNYYYKKNKINVVTRVEAERCGAEDGFLSVSHQDLFTG